MSGCLVTMRQPRGGRFLACGTPSRLCAATAGSTVTPDATLWEREYRALMRKWWFGATVGVYTMILS